MHSIPSRNKASKRSRDSENPEALKEIENLAVTAGAKLLAELPETFGEEGFSDEFSSFAGKLMTAIFDQMRKKGKDVKEIQATLEFIIDELADAAPKKLPFEQIADLQAEKEEILGSKAIAEAQFECDWTDICADMGLERDKGVNLESIPKDTEVIDEFIKNLNELGKGGPENEEEWRIYQNLVNKYVDLLERLSIRCTLLGSSLDTFSQDTTWEVIANIEERFLVGPFHSTFTSMPVRPPLLGMTSPREEDVVNDVLSHLSSDI